MLKHFYKKVRPFLVRLIHCNTLMRKTAYFLRNMFRTWNYVRKYSTKHCINEKLVVFEAYQGQQFACSPKALFLEMVSNPKYADMQKIWFFKNPEKYQDLLSYPNTHLVLYRSSEYYTCYAKAKYWISNSNLPPYIRKKPEQIYIQTWHGTPFKKIGCDLTINENPNTTLKEVYRKYILEGRRADYFLSPSPYYTEHIKSAFHIQNPTKVLEYGYPRNDNLYDVTDQKISVLKKTLGIPENKKVILYAPTWRDNQFKPGTGAVYDLHIDFKQLQYEFGSEYLILFRTHYFISNTFDFSRFHGFIQDVSGYDDINELYMISDLLITDYSSVFFDFANLKKPIVFYMYDYEEYKSRLRDFYFDEKLLPGVIVKNQEALAETVKQAFTKWTCTQEYRHFNDMFNPYPHRCSNRVLDKCINN